MPAPGKDYASPAERPPEYFPLRTLRIERPWPTAFARSTRTARLITVIAIVQFVFNTIERIAEGHPYLASIWFSGALLVGISTIHIERYFLRQGRLHR